MANVWLLWQEVQLATESGGYVFTQYPEGDARRYETGWMVDGCTVYLSNDLFTLHCQQVGITDAVIERGND